MMSIFLTEELENKTARKSDAEMLFFFCSAQDEKRNTGVAVLRGILYQIMAKCPQLITHALPYFETPERTQQTLLSLETLWIIFTKLVADTALGTMFCVIDGLDECDESATRVLLPRIVGLLTANVSSTTGMFKLAVISREIHALRGCSCSRIKLDPDNDAKVDSDIELFVSTRVQELSGIEGFNNDFRSFVQESLVERAEGTFLWVGFAMYELLQKETCSEVLEVLEDLPTGLPAIYDRMLLQIPARHRKVSQAILRWVTFAVRPLELDELADAVGLQPRHPHLTTEQVARDAVARCGPLLKMQEQEVSLVHQSMRDYLLREEHESNAVLDAFRLQLEPSHLELARKCLDCLAQSNLKYKRITKTELKVPPNSPLLHYAMSNWPEHARNCTALAAGLMDPHGFFLKKVSPVRIHWLFSYSRRFDRSINPQNLLHVACRLGIIPWVEAVLSKKRWMPRIQERVNMGNLEGRTALHYAASSGDIALVQLLLNRGADIKTEDSNGITALHIAAKEGNMAVMQLLLNHGADTEAKTNTGRTALHYATDNGNKAVVQLLLERGADVEPKDDDKRTAFHTAVEEGNAAVVQLLLNRGADVHARYQFGCSALHIAVFSGSEAVVQLLLDRGAIVKDDGETLLHSAAMLGNKAIVQLLLDKEANMEAKNRFGETLLHSAAMFGHKVIVQLLLDGGADIEGKNRFGETALHCSARQEEEDVVYLLVDRGADVNAKDNDGNTALQKAMVGKSRKLSLSIEGKDPAKRKAISDFLRSRMNSSERSDINQRTAPDPRPLRNQHGISNPPTRPPNPFPRERQHTLSRPPPYK
jgi:ankyrin repeat protein